MNPVVDASATLVVVSHVVFALAAVLLLTAEMRRVRARAAPAGRPVGGPVSGAAGSPIA